MAFGWSAGDIVSGISTLVKVGKAVKESGGAASEYQETIAFLASVETTLRGLDTVVVTNPDLTWKAELVEQAGLLKSAVDDFKTKVDKYDLSLGSASERKKARRIPREVQFALSDKVKELRIAITQPQLVLDVFINLQTLTSILDLSKSNSISQENLQAWIDEMAQVLPTITDSFATLQQAIQTEILDIKTIQKTAHTRVQDDLSQIKDCVGELRDFQTTLLTQSAVTGQDLRRWQGEFQQTVQALCTYTKDQLDLLLMNRREPIETVRGSGSSLQVAISTFQFFINGLASGIGTLTALALYALNNPPIRASLPPLQWRRITNASMTDGLAPNDGRWDEAFQLAAESSRDGTRNRLSKHHKGLPAAPAGIHLNEEDPTRLETYLKSRKQFRNTAASPVSGADPSEDPQRSHASNQIQRFRNDWLWECCQCLLQVGMATVINYCPKCEHTRCTSCCMISTVYRKSHDACDSVDIETGSSSPLSTNEFEASHPDDTPRRAAARAFPPKFEVGNSAWLTIPNGDSVVKVEVVALRHEFGEYFYQVKDTRGILYQNKQGKWVSERKLEKY